MTRRFPLLAAFAAVLLLLASPAPAQDLGQSLKRTAERAAQSEVERAVDRETRRVTRCVLGDERCASDARGRGEDVRFVEPGTSTQGGGDSAPGASFRVEPYAGSTVRETGTLAFDAFNLVVGKESNGDLRARTVEGRITRTLYNNPPGRSTLELIRNYEQALQGRGLRLLHQCAGRDACGGTGTREANWNNVAGMNIGVGGDFRYVAAEGAVGASQVSVAVMVNKHRTWVTVVESAAMQSGQVGVNADALAAGLAQGGKVRLDGIYFDTGLATLKPQSRAALAEVAELLRRYPGLKLEIVGHTDAVGDDTVNLRLSESRALAVRSALVLEHGVADPRLATRGAGETEPVAPNDSEAGRALNRRVELVRR